MRNARRSRSENFQLLAQRYCTLIRNFRKRSIVSLILSLDRLLPALYSSGLLLPRRSRSGRTVIKEMSHAEWQRLFEGLRRRLGDRDWYRATFDPYDRKDADAMWRSLADDLADIHRDLSNGLSYWRARDRGAAVREWRFGIDYHWGEHAIAAMKALHWLRVQYEPGANPDLPEGNPLAPKSRAIRPTKSPRSGRPDRTTR